MNEYNFVINGNPYKVHIIKITEEKATVAVNGAEYEVNVADIFQHKTPKLVNSPVIQEKIERTKLTDAPGKDLSFNTIKAPLPGLVLKIPVKVGDKVKVGQTVIIMEAMKMENDIQSPVSGEVKEIFVQQGESVLEQAPLLKIG